MRAERAISSAAHVTSDLAVWRRAELELTFDEDAVRIPCERVQFEPLARVYRELVARALAEDYRRGDVTTEATVDASSGTRAPCAKSRVRDRRARRCRPRRSVSSIRPSPLTVKDGDVVRAGNVVAEIAGMPQHC